MTRTRLLGLCCGQGGGDAGYHRAGYDVTGVDLALKRLPDGTFTDDPDIPARYPFTFVKADILDVLADSQFMSQFDAVAGSPPCQGYSKMTTCRPGAAAGYAKLIGEVRSRLAAWGGPWIIENVEGSGLASQDDLFGTHGVMLCGAMFGRPLYRHRYFEANFPLYAPNHPRHDVPASKAGHWEPGTVISVAGNCAPIGLAREAMDIGWMTRDGLAEAIPPYFTEFLGRQMLATATGMAA